MIDAASFKDWLKQNTSFQRKAINDTVSRLKRADSIIPFNGDDYYIAQLGNSDSFKNLSVYVRSQLRRAVKLYQQFQIETKNGK